MSTHEERLAAHYQRQLERIRNATSAQARVEWEAGRQAARERVARDRMVQTVLSGQRAAVAATDAYISVGAGMATGTSTAPVGVDDRAIGRAARNGVFLEDVYDRPNRIYTEGLAAGTDTATRDALRNLNAAVLADIQLATRNAAAARMGADQRVTGYRRVLGPGNNCGLCIVASTRRYGTAELMPIHTNCRCGIQPILSTRRPSGEVVDRDRLDGFLNQLDDGSAYSSPDLTHLGAISLDGDSLPQGIDPQSLPLATVVRHGELGPFLYVQGQRFTTLN